MKNTLIITLSLFAFSLFGQEQETEEVNWITIEEAYELNQTQPKKILVDIYTDWCGWCKRMDKTTYANPAIVKYINENFYAVKLDAEQKEDITILDNTFKFVGEGRKGYHELAAALLQGKMSYPTTVFLDESFNMIQPIAGYLDAKGIEPILWYFGSDAFKTEEWTAFNQGFKSEL
jgi:thioredoxin-related protein